MQVTSYRISENALPLVPAKKERVWMDNTVHKYAYRCLPLSIANSHGWEFLSPHDFMVEWNGGEHQKDITFEVEGENDSFPCSVFGAGIMTIHTETLIRTDENWNLYVTGSPNFSVPWASPLTGIVETWWLDFTFTLNWKLHHPGSFWFQKGDPLGFIFPIPAVYEIDAVSADITDNPELYDRLKKWGEDRKNFNDHAEIAHEQNIISGPVDPNKPQTHWEKNYMRGVDKEGNRIPNHKTKVKFPEFK